MLHDVFERDAQLDGNLKKAPKLTLKVLHPVSNKQKVLLLLEFLQLFQKWWIISNSKSQFSITNYLGNAAILGDEKPTFLRAFGFQTVKDLH